MKTCSPFRTLCFAITLLPVAASDMAAQIVMYKTYEDYQNKHGERLGEFFAIRGGGHQLIYNSLPNRDKIKEAHLELKDYWGFYYLGDIFRVDPTLELCMMVVRVGDAIYYENGEVSATAIKNGGYRGLRMSWGYMSYVSKDLTSTIVPLAPEKGRLKGENVAAVTAFKQANPTAAPFLDCMGEELTHDKAVECAKVHLQKAPVIPSP